MADSLNLELESNAEEYELTLGDDSQRYLELTVEDKMYEVEKGGGTDTAIALIERTITEANYPTITTVGANAFDSCKSLTSVALPACTQVLGYSFQSCKTLPSIDLPTCKSVGTSAFTSCSALSSVNLPECTKIGSYAFQSCVNLKSITLPACTSLSDYAFYQCSYLTRIDLPVCSSVPYGGFSGCYSLQAVILRKSDSVAGLGNTKTFDNCYHFWGTKNSTYNPDGLRDGYIYVPDALVDSYKTATNWSTFASQIKPLSELPSE